MKRNALIALIVVTVLSVSSVAQANVGTPLMWASALHLVFGNFVIGVLEGLLLAKFFKVPAGRAIGLMIIANFWSAWLAGLWLLGLITRQIQFDLYNTWRLLWLMVGVTYAVTLVLEWPFVAGCFWRDPKWFRRSLAGSLVAQTVSYVLLFGWYWMASGTSLYTKMNVVPHDAISLPDSVLMYYISDEDGDVYLREVGSASTTKVFDLNSTDKEDCLSLRRDPLDSKQWHVVALLDSGDLNNPKVVDVGRSYSEDGLPRDREKRIAEGDRTFWRTAHEDARLGEALSSPWELRSGFWAIEGLHGENSKSGAEFYFALETPFAAWPIRHMTHLPTDKVLFQLGERQICVVDAESKRIGLLAYGRGPLAVLNEKPLVESSKQRDPSRGIVEDHVSGVP